MIIIVHIQLVRLHGYSAKNPTQYSNTLEIRLQLHMCKITSALKLNKRKKSPTDCQTWGRSRR